MSASSGSSPHSITPKKTLPPTPLDAAVTDSNANGSTGFTTSTSPNWQQSSAVAASSLPNSNSTTTTTAYEFLNNISTTDRGFVPFDGESKMKRRSRSFTDISDFTTGKISAFQPYPVSYGSAIPWQWPVGGPLGLPPAPGLMLPPGALMNNSTGAMQQSKSPLNGKVAISRAPDGISGKPVHIVTKQEKKLAHSAMERRYRKELNVQINQLRMLVPSCEDISGANINKVGVLKKATEYVRQLRQQDQLTTTQSAPKNEEATDSSPELEQLRTQSQQLADQLKVQQQIIEHYERLVHQLNAEIMTRRLIASGVFPSAASGSVFLPSHSAQSASSQITVPSMGAQPRQGNGQRPQANHPDIKVEDPFDVGSFIDSYSSRQEATVSASQKANVDVTLGVGETEDDYFDDEFDELDSSLVPGRSRTYSV